MFLGTSEAHPETAYVAFRNTEGADLYLKLSWEALDALCELRRDTSRGGQPAIYPHKPREVVMGWKQVIPQEAAQSAE